MHLSGFLKNRIPFVVCGFLFDLLNSGKTTKAEEEVLFLDEHLLWLRSAKSFSLQDLANIPASLQWTLNPHHWWQFARNQK